MRQAQAAAARQASPWWRPPGRERLLQLADRGDGDPGVWLHGLLPGATQGSAVLTSTTASTSPMARGTPIRAAADGVVAFIGSGGGGAFVVVMGHAGGYETLYGHLLRALYRPCRPVRQEGPRHRLHGLHRAAAPGPHLHWEVILNGTNVNPRSVVLARSPTGHDGWVGPDEPAPRARVNRPMMGAAQPCPQLHTGECSGPVSPCQSDGRK